RALLERLRDGVGVVLEERVRGITVRRRSASRNRFFLQARRQAHFFPFGCGGCGLRAETTFGLLAFELERIELVASSLLALGAVVLAHGGLSLEGLRN